MEKTYSEQTSTFGNIKANIIVLAIWLSPFILGWLINFSYANFLIPILVLLLEKKSELVRSHAGQALALYVLFSILSAILNFVLDLLALGTTAVAISTGSAAASVGGLAGFGFVGILFFVLAIFQLVFIILACLRGWRWQTYHLPVLGSLGDWFTKKIRLT